VHEALGPAQFPASKNDRRLASPVGVDERFAARSSQLDHLFVCRNERRAQLERVASQCADDVAAFDEVIGDCGRIEVGAQADASAVVRPVMPALRRCYSHTTMVFCCRPTRTAMIYAAPIPRRPLFRGQRATTTSSVFRLRVHRGLILLCRS
jgi:hypothetical protein